MTIVCNEEQWSYLDGGSNDTIVSLKTGIKTVLSFILTSCLAILLSFLQVFLFIR